ncbi:unnamed protein product [Paramecium sonneborni]|uniref:Uncharacterized protein n=1 Tax=Paramecium sonneborni TaxID=65129 RepID=A0A8S1L8T3_9CILI|nr:unnamed protein product [Paramecium sonneborni]
MKNSYQQIQKQSSLAKKTKNIQRGKYKKIPVWLKVEIMNCLINLEWSLDEVANFFQVNKETIRSHYKNQKKKPLYSELQCYLVKKYLTEHNYESPQEQEKIFKYIKQKIDDSANDHQLQEILKVINIKRLESKTKKKNPPIQFTSKNRRIIYKISQYIKLAGAAAKKDTVSINIDEMIKKDFYSNFLYQYISYDPQFANQIQNDTEFNSSQEEQEEPLTDTRLFITRRE